jgi:DNA-binding CsgD family transcriptional regulator
MRLRLGRASMFDAYRLVAVGARSEIRAAARTVSPTEPPGMLLQAVLAQYEGDVDGAIGILRRLARRVSGGDRAIVADVLAPILVMRHVTDEVLRCANTLQTAGWLACADAFRALAAIDEGRRRSARRRAARAREALEHESSDIVRFRVLQRLARIAFLLNDHAEAVDAASASAQLCVAAGAWRAAGASYSIIYNVHHNVTGNLPEADRHAILWRETAEKSDDRSFQCLGLIAEYEIAVQLADTSRVAELEKLIAWRGLPQQYVERFPHALSYAIARGWSDLRAMRTLLEVLLAVPETCGARSALCHALIALSAAAQSDDDQARLNIRDALRDLGRSREASPAYDRRYRRIARACAAAACLLLNDDVRALRTVAVRESQQGDGEDSLPLLMREGRLDAAPAGVRGLARVFALAAEEHRLQAVPADLTAAQFQVLQLLGRGWSAQRIAAETGRTRNTVYNHTRAILVKLEARRAAEAVAIARERGILI